MSKFFFNLQNESDETLFYQLIKAKICVVDFSASWCMPCKKLSYDLESNIPNQQKIIDNLLLPTNNLNNIQNKIVFVKINVDELSNLTTLFNVKGIPHIVFFKDGILQKQIINGNNASEVIQTILNFI